MKYAKKSVDFKPWFVIQSTQFDKNKGNIMKTTKTIFAIFALILAAAGLFDTNNIFYFFSDGLKAVSVISTSLLIASVIGLVANNSVVGNSIAALFYLAGYGEGVDVETSEIYRETLDLYTNFSLICAIIFFVGACRLALENKNNATQTQEKTSSKSKIKGEKTHKQKTNKKQK